MVVRDGPIAEVDGLDVPLRPFGRREHTFPGIDVALTPWPGMDVQQAAIRRDLRALLVPRLCVQPVDGGRIAVQLDNIGAGHMFPSGATVDRRAWVEVVAWDAAGEIVFSSGVIPPATPLLDPEELADPNLWTMGTPARDAQGQPTELFWKIATLDYPGTLLQPAVTTDPMDPRFYHATERFYPVVGLLPRIARVRLRVLIRPVPMKLIEELLTEGFLTVDLRPAVPTHVVEGATLEWTPAADGECVPD